MLCIEFSDIIQSNEHQVDVLTEVARKHPDPQVPAACQAFSRQVRLVESVVEGTYVIAVEATRKSESLEEIAQVWQATGSLCDKALGVVSGLKDRYRYCGTPELHDRLLDYKLACTRRYEQ
ncbi:MAG: hypothetical protein Q8M07_16320, partial [Prosthecobacter sp.]|nr:hypothetical protein [Prosthecobacter sp.]